MSRWLKESATSSCKPRLLKRPAKVPTWTKDLTLEIYTKQLLTWTDILEDIPEHVMYQDLMEPLKTNKEVKGLPRYVGEHVLPTLEKKSDQTILKVLDLLDSKYGRTKTERIEEIMDEWIKFKDDSFEDDRELLLGMKELRQRKKELNITEDEWDTVWMLTIVKKRKKIDKFIFQALRDIVKQGGDDVIKKF